MHTCAHVCTVLVSHKPTHLRKFTHVCIPMPPPVHAHMNVNSCAHADTCLPLYPHTCVHTPCMFTCRSACSHPVHTSPACTRPCTLTLSHSPPMCSPVGAPPRAATHLPGGSGGGGRRVPFKGVGDVAMAAGGRTASSLLVKGARI